MTDKPKLYSTAEAAAYLGVHLQTLKYHLQKEHLAADYEVSGNLLFLQSTLDAFKATHQAEGLPMQQAADYLGVSVRWLRYHVHTAKDIAPSGKRDNAWVFTPQTLDEARQRLLNK